MARRTTRPELTAEQQAEADRIHAALLQAAADDLRELAELLATKDDSNTFGATEFAVRDIVLRVGAKAVETALAERKKGVRRVQPSLPHVRRGGQVPAVAVQARRDRAGPGAGGAGVLLLPARATPGTARGMRRLGLGGGDLSRGASEAVALAGALSSFAEAAEKTLPKLCGLRVSESTVERVTERVGADVGERLAARARRSAGRSTGSGREDADGKTVGYVSADLTGVRMQGANGATADGRMAAVGMVCNAGVPGQARYVCGLTGGQAGLGQPLRNQAAQVGLDRAERWVAISDGGAGLEDLLRATLPAGGGGHPRLLPRGRTPERVGEGVAPGRRGRGRAGGRRVVPPAEARGRGGGAGRACERWTCRAVRRRCGRRTGSCWCTSGTRCTGWTTRRTGRRGG